MNDRVLVQNDEFIVTGDSVIQGHITACASTPYHIETSLTMGRLDSIAKSFYQGKSEETSKPRFLGGRPWHGEQPNEQYPRFQSRQSLVNALYNMSTFKLAQASSDDTFAYSDTLNLYLSIYLSMALLDPERAQTTLRQLVGDDGKVVPIGQWPAHGGRLAWAVAAWEVYLVTGDKQWLQYVHQVVSATLAEERQLMQTADTPLWHGAATGLPTAFHPSWMTASDLWQTFSLQANVLAAKATDILQDIEEELNGEQAAADHANNSPQRLKDAINQQLWNESAGYFSAYRYGLVHPIQAPLCDNTAQALAVIWDIADDDRATTLVTKTPIGHRGINVMYPHGSFLEPYFSHPTWTATQTLWAMAATHVGNTAIARRSLGALLRALALFEARNIRVEGIAEPDHLTSAASFTASIFRVMAGMTFSPEGIEFTPYVPQCMPADKTIYGIHYRHSSLSLVLRGTGNEVAQITLDGKRIEGNFVPTPVDGNHQIVVTLKWRQGNSGKTTISSPAIQLPNMPDVTWKNDSACILNFVTGDTYRMLVNGQRGPSVSDMALKWRPEHDIEEVAIVATNKYGYSFMSRPAVIAAEKPITVTLADSLASDTIACQVRVPQAGTYLAQLNYHPSNGNDVLMVWVNTHPQGIFVLPAFDKFALPSGNYVRLRLLRGNNNLLLVRKSHLPQPSHPTTLFLYNMTTQ